MIPLARLTLYVATAGAVITAAATAMGRLESTKYVLLAIAVYIVLLLLGLFQPSLRMFADAIVRAPGTGTESVAFLVESDLDPAFTNEWLKLFEEKKHSVTLLVTAEIAEKSQELLLSLIKRGHAVGALGPVTTRRLADKSLVEALERESDAWDPLQQEQDLLWLPEVLYTDRLARIAQAFERDLVVCSHDLREAQTVDELLAKSKAVLQKGGGGAIVRFRDGTVFRAAIAGILDVATQVGVGVRTLL